MNSKPNHLVSFERVTSLIETYGSNTQCWPEQERDAALLMLAGSSELQRLYKQAEQLDAVLLTAADSVTTAGDDAVLQRLIDNLPAQAHRRRWQWPAGLAASLLVALLVVNQLPLQQAQQPGTELALNDMDYLMWQEVTGQETLDTADEVVADFMGLVELESDNG